MAEPFEPRLVKLICGMISARTELFDAALAPLTQAYGPVDIVSDIMNFDFTHYYDAEMGSPLYRRFVSFDRLVSPEILPAVKCATNALERTFAQAQGAGARVDRPINLDPGYIEPAKLVLASMKNFAHRICLSRGVYAEVTLQWHKMKWESLPWTFPDYGSGRYFPFLTASRDRFREQTLHGDPS